MSIHMLLNEVKQMEIVFQGLLTIHRNGSATVELNSGRKINYAVAPKAFADVVRIPERPQPVTFNAKTQGGMMPYNVYVHTNRVNQA